MRKWSDDPYTKKARKQDYEARSVFKLEEIDKREFVTRGAKNILDLGASPGSWTQYCLRHSPSVKMWAIDLNPLNFSDARLQFVQASIYDFDIPKWLGDIKVDVVLSDMAPKTTGIHETDVAGSLELALKAFQAASSCLKDGGHFVVKVFMGDGFESYRDFVKTRFEQIRLLRPDSTRKHSREIFLIGKGFLPPHKVAE
jgi:23S rRNA (uridine2552-2'-O)-methyltransferase